MSSQVENYLLKIVKYDLYAILLTPLVFWPRALYGFMTPKFILFQVLVEIVFAVWIILLIYRSKFIQTLADLHRNYIFLVLEAFITVSFISAIFGVDFSRSFWGIGARMTGLFAELHFFIWFLILLGYFKNDKEKWFRYINFSFFGALLVALSAFYENTAWRLVYGSTIFNNPTFVTPYLLFHFFWGLYQFLNNSNRKKWLFGFGSLLLAFVIFLGEIRGAVFGLFIGIIVLGSGLIFSNVIKRRFKIFIFAFFILVITSLVGLWLARNSSFVQNFSALKRLTQISLGQTTVQTRLMVWQLAIKGFKDKVLFGAGPENFNYVFNAHYNPSLLKYGLGETWFDKPHNAFLQILTEIGAIGGLAYLLILSAVSFAIFRLFKTGQKILSITLASAFIAYLISMFFSFDSFGSWFGLYLFLAFLASYNSNANNTNEHTNKTLKDFLSRNLFVTFVLIGTFGLGYFNYGMWRANIADADALRIFSHDPAQGVVLFKKSLAYFSPYKSEYQFDLIASIAGAVEKGMLLPSLEDTINFSLGEADKAVAVHPKDAAKYTDMIRIYNIFGTRGRDPKILAQAETFGNKSLELSPNRQETLFYLARTALLKNDFKSAVELTKLAVDADPAINLSHWYFGLALIADNRREAGIMEIKKAIELGYKTQNETERNFINQLGL